ncbi:Holliday junction recognition protein isoform X1 [Engystomops pustulosus]|uniref:Holliday junction recognition protein isoform X1 n=2 Tax=Engystomops pustulosus TaxID=76066 RepID=UPI003AFA0A58
MEKSKSAKNCKTSGSRKFGEEMDFSTLLDKNNEIFSARMRDIFTKYNQPFENDIVINIEDLTYETPKGPRPWNFKTDTPVNAKSSSAIKQPESNSRKPTPCYSSEESSSQHSEKILSTTFCVKPFTGNTSASLMEYKDVYEDSTDHTGNISTNISDLSAIGKTMYVTLPLKTVVSETIKNGESPGKYNMAVRQADESVPFDSEEASYSEFGNKTLDDYYPEMIDNLCSIWDIDKKNQAADHIIRRYKRYVWYKKFRKTLTNQKLSKSAVCPAFSAGEASVAPAVFNATFLQGMHFSKSGLEGAIEIASPKSRLYSQTHKNKDSFTLQFNFKQNAKTTFDKWAIHMNNPFPEQQKNMNDMSPAYSSRASSSPCKKAIGPLASKSQRNIETALSPSFKDFKQLQQNIPPIIRRNSFSGLSSLQSPKKGVAITNCLMSEKTKTPTKAEQNRGSYKEYLSRQQNRSCTLTRRNSFSAFPVAGGGNRDFENLYRKLTNPTPQSGFSLDKDKVHLSKTVSSLVNSPGSIRAKRQFTPDSFFSISKKPRSAMEALIGSSKSSSSMDRSELSWSEGSTSFIWQHSVIASSRPADMLPRSPVSQRLFYPADNGGSPKRTNARSSK